MLSESFVASSLIEPGQFHALEAIKCSWCCGEERRGPRRPTQRCAQGSGGETSDEKRGDTDDDECDDQPGAAAHRMQRPREQWKNRPLHAVAGSIQVGRVVAHVYGIARHRVVLLPVEPETRGQLVAREVGVYHVGRRTVGARLDEVERVRAALGHVQQDVRRHAQRGQRGEANDRLPGQR